MLGIGARTRRGLVAVSVLGLLLALLLGTLDLLPLEFAGAAGTADLALAIAGPHGPVNQGEPFVWTYTVENKGPDAAEDEVLSATVSGAVTIIRTPAGCTLASERLTCEVASLAAGTKREYELELSTTSTGGAITEGTVSSATADPEPADNSKKERTEVLIVGHVTEADLVLSFTASKDPVAPGEPITYTFRVDNKGPQTAENLGVSEFTPDNLEVLSEDPECGFVEGQMYCGFDPIGPGEHREAHFVVAAESGPATIVNEAVINDPENHDPVPGDDAATLTTTVTAPSSVVHADLNVGIVDSKDPVMVDEPFSYTVTVGNAGPEAAEEVEATITLPPSLEVKSVDSDCGAIVGSVHCELGTLAAGAKASRSFTVVATSAGTASVEAKVTAVGSIDPNPGDDTAIQTTEVRAAAPPPSPPATGPPTPPLFAHLNPLETHTPITKFAVVETHATGLVTGATFKVDGANAFQTPTATPYVGFTFSTPGTHTITETLTGAGGNTFTSSTVLQVTAAPKSSGLMTFGSGGFRPDVAVASKNLEIFLQAAKELACTPGATVVFGVVEAEGCFTRIETTKDIPPSEREVVEEYFTTSFLIERQGNEFCRAVSTSKCHAEYLNNGPLNQKPYISRGPIKVNGMTIEPVGGASVVLFPALSRIVSSNARISYDGGVFGHIPVRSGSLNLDLGSGVRHLNETDAELNLFTFNTSQAFHDIGGFPIDGQVDIALKKAGDYRSTQLEVNLGLPKELTTAAGTDPTVKVDVEADNRRGTYLGFLNFHIDEAFLGPVELANLDFTYKAEGGGSEGCSSAPYWKATAEVFFLPVDEEGGAGIRMAPEPQRNGISFCAGEFLAGGAELKFGYPIPPPEIFPGVTLNAIEFDFRLQKPVLFDGSATIKAAEYVTATGGFLAAFATPGNPYTFLPGDAGGTLRALAGSTYRSPTFAVGGRVFIAPVEDVELEMGSAYLLYSYPDYVVARGSANLQTFLFAINASAGLEMSTRTRKFNVLLEGNVCLAGGIKIAGIGACVGGEARVSSRGLSVCFNFGDGAWTPGVGDVYGRPPEFFLGTLGDGCKPSHFWEKDVRSPDARILAHASTVGPLTFRVVKGEKAKTVELTGSGGAPAVTVTGPAGTIVTQPDLMFREGHLSALAANKYERTWIGLEDARPGVYKIVPQPGSAPITNLRETRYEPGATVKASVAGSGRHLVLHYDAGHAQGQTVTFLERGKGTFHPLKTVTGGKGTVAFQPAFGPGGKRAIVAQVEVDGIPAPLQTLAHFKAPAPPRAKKVGGVRVTRHGSKLAVAWNPVPYAHAYGVVITGGGGAVHSLRVAPAHHAATLKHVAADEGGTVEVVAFSPLGERGEPGRASFKATHRPSTRLLPYKELGKATPFKRKRS